MNRNLRVNLIGVSGAGKTVLINAMKGMVIPQNKEEYPKNKKEYPRYEVDLMYEQIRSAETNRPDATRVLKVAKAVIRVIKGEYSGFVLDMPLIDNPGQYFENTHGPLGETHAEILKFIRDTDVFVILLDVAKYITYDNESNDSDKSNPDDRTARMLSWVGEQISRSGKRKASTLFVVSKIDGQNDKIIVSMKTLRSLLPDDKVHRNYTSLGNCDEIKKNADFISSHWPERENDQNKKPEKINDAWTISQISTWLSGLDKRRGELVDEFMLNALRSAQKGEFEARIKENLPQTSLMIQQWWRSQGHTYDFIGVSSFGSHTDELAVASINLDCMLTRLVELAHGDRVPNWMKKLRPGVRR